MLLGASNSLVDKGSRAASIGRSTRCQSSQLINPMDNSFTINRFCNLINEPDQARKAGHIVIDEALPAAEPANMVLRESAAVTAQSQRIGKPSMGNLVKSQPSELRVAIAGLGSIGTKVAEAL